MARQLLRGVLILALLSVCSAWAERDGGSVSGPARNGVIRDTPGRVHEYRGHDSDRHERDRRFDRDRGERGHGFDHGQRRVRPPVVIGVPVIVGPQYYPYPPSDYIDPIYDGQDGNFWYYCPDIGYYPDVLTCPNGWLRVIPAQ